jgi:eukaryotic-like serine/threonine-protein kinase
MPKSAWITAWVILGVLVLGSMALLSERVRMGISRSFASSVQHHIAVLPFENLGGDAGNEAVTQGLMDSLTSKLSNLDAGLDTGQQSLWVAPSSVVRSRKVNEPAAAARDPGATLVVMGSLEQPGKDVRLTVNLIDAKNLRQIGSASLEDHSGNLETLQEESVTRLAKMMNIRMTAEMARAAGGAAARAAYESYLKALGYMQRYDKAGNLDQAIGAG